MVDPTKGVGQVQHIQSANKASSAREEKRAEEAREFKPLIDEVHISPEALSLSQAERTSTEVREKLERDKDVTLGLDPDFDRDA